MQEKEKIILQENISDLEHLLQGLSGKGVSDEALVAFLIQSAVVLADVRTDMTFSELQQILEDKRSALNSKANGVDTTPFKPNI